MGDGPPTILVINRAVDTARLEAFRQAAAPFHVGFEIVVAVDGHASDFDVGRYAWELRNGWNGRSKVKPGALACFLSHIDAWRQVAEGPDAAALILEDDAHPSRAPSEVMAVEPWAQILFVNQPLSTWVPEGREAASLTECVLGLLADGRPLKEQPRKVTPGAQAYRLTRTAARRLLDRVDRLGIRAGADYFLCSAAVDGSSLVDDPRVAHVFGSAMQEAIAHADPTGIPAAVLRKPLCVHMRTAGGGSVIDHSQRVPIPGLHS